MIFLQKIFVCWDPHSFPRVSYGVPNRVSQPVCPSLPQQDSWEPQGPQKVLPPAPGHDSNRFELPEILKGKICIWKRGVSKFEGEKTQKKTRFTKTCTWILVNLLIFHLDFPWNHWFLDPKNYPSLWVVIHHVTAVIRPFTSNPIPQIFWWSPTVQWNNTGLPSFLERHHRMALSS